MKGCIVCSGSDLVTMGDELMSRGVSLRFRVRGISMRPCIKDGALVTVETVHDVSLTRGDVVLYRGEDDRVLLHRIIKKEGVETFHIKGDASFSEGEVVKRDMILGRVTVVEQGGKRLNYDKGPWRVINRLRALLLCHTHRFFPLLHAVRVRTEGIVRRLSGTFGSQKT